MGSRASSCNFFVRFAPLAVHTSRAWPFGGHHRSRLRFPKPGSGGTRLAIACEPEPDNNRSAP